jgi:hypothetical protein
MEKLEKMKSSLPPQARAELDKAGVAPVFAFKRASGSDTIAGIPCENYAMTRDGADSGSACLSSWKHSSVLTRADLKPMTQLAERMKSFKIPSSDMQMGPEMDKWPGWPLLTRGKDGKERTRVLSVSRTTFPESEFVPPPDYTQKAISMGGGMPPPPGSNSGVGQ